MVLVSEHVPGMFSDPLSSTLRYFFVSGLSLMLVVVVRTFYLLHSVRKTRQMSDPRTNSSEPFGSTSAKSPLKTLVVLGSGGHTTEMLDLIKNLKPDRYGPIVLVVANTDTTSLQRVQAYPHALPIQNKQNLVSLESTGDQQQVYRIPRSREVGQSYASSILTTLRSFLFALWLVGYQVGEIKRKFICAVLMTHTSSPNDMSRWSLNPSFQNLSVTWVVYLMTRQRVLLLY